MCEVETSLPSLPDSHLALHGSIHCEFHNNHVMLQLYYDREGFSHIVKITTFLDLDPG